MCCRWNRTVYMEDIFMEYQSNPAQLLLSFCGGQTPTDLRENTKKSLIKRSKPKRVKNRSRLYGFAVAWAIFDQNDVFSHINSNDEGDILSWIQIQPGMQLVGLDLYGKHWKHQFTYWLFSNGFRLCIYSTLVHWTSVSTNIIYKKIASLAFNYYNYNLITLNQLFAHCSK